MKHSIRQRIINEYGLPVVKIEQVTGELGGGFRILSRMLGRLVGKAEYTLLHADD